jgi:hypothetical protein
MLERRDVGIINRQGASVWVSGIASGERVVTQLNNTLFPGLRVATQRAVN